MCVPSPHWTSLRTAGPPEVCSLNLLRFTSGQVRSGVDWEGPPHPNAAVAIMHRRADWLAMPARYRTAVAGVKGLTLRKTQGGRSSHRLLERPSRDTSMRMDANSIGARGWELFLQGKEFAAAAKELGVPVPQLYRSLEEHVESLPQPVIDTRDTPGRRGWLLRQQGHSYRSTAAALSMPIASARFAIREYASRLPHPLLVDIQRRRDRRCAESAGSAPAAASACAQ